MKSAVGLLVVVLWAAFGAPQMRVLHLEVDNLTQDERAGVELGLAEATQTAALMGVQVSVQRTPASVTIGRIFGGQESVSISHSSIPVIHLHPTGSGPAEAQCRFRMMLMKDDITWHSTLSRYGASELNERFEKRFGRPMNSGAWNGWFAVKALLETALREEDQAKLCGALERGRFDGHKGRPLSFVNGLLQQPLYVIGRDGRAVER